MVNYPVNIITNIINPIRPVSKEKILFLYAIMIITKFGHKSILQIKTICSFYLLLLTEPIPKPWKEG